MDGLDWIGMDGWKSPGASTSQMDIAPQTHQEYQHVCLHPGDKVEAYSRNTITLALTWGCDESSLMILMLMMVIEVVSKQNRSYLFFPGIACGTELTGST